MSEAWPHDSLGQPRLRSDRELTRRTILYAAARLAAVNGLETVSIGSLASVIGMSKTALRALFGSEQELQLAIVEEAARVFA